MPRRPPPPPHALTTLSPLRLLTQILTLQLLYYLCTTTLILFTALTAGKPFTPDLVLSWRSLRGDTTVGWTLGLCWMGGSFCGSVSFPLLCSLSFFDCFGESWKLTSNVIHTQQRDPPALPHRALETSPRLRALPPRHPPARNVAVHAQSARELAVVGAHECERGADDGRGRVELSVEGAEAY